jgi:hypothetical protein
MDRSSLDRAASLYEQACEARRVSIDAANSEGAGLLPGQPRIDVESDPVSSGLEDLVARAEGLKAQAYAALEAAAFGNVLAGSNIGYGEALDIDPKDAARAIADAESATSDLRFAFLEMARAARGADQLSLAISISRFLVNTGSDVVASPAREILRSIQTEQARKELKAGRLELLLDAVAQPGILAELEVVVADGMIEAALGRADLAVSIRLFEMLWASAAAKDSSLAQLRQQIHESVSGGQWKVRQKRRLGADGKQLLGIERGGKATVSVSVPVFSPDGMAVALSYVGIGSQLDDDIRWRPQDCWGGIVVDALSCMPVGGFEDRRLGKTDRDADHWSLLRPVITYAQTGARVDFDASGRGRVTVDLQGNQVVRLAQVPVDTRVATARVALQECLMETAQRIHPGCDGASVSPDGRLLAAVALGREGSDVNGYWYWLDLTIAELVDEATRLVAEAPDESATSAIRRVRHEPTGSLLRR